MENKESVANPVSDHQDAASAVDGDAEDNTTTVDCSSDDKARGKRTGDGSGGVTAAVSAMTGGKDTGNGKKPSRRSRCRRGKNLERVRLTQGQQQKPQQQQQRNRRRGKTKKNRRRSGGQLMATGKKSANWPLGGGPSGDGWRANDQMQLPSYPIVPYNTNRFLMEYHMPEVVLSGVPVGRDEFLTNEFSTVYETARCERLEELTKAQLIQEYLQLEGNYDQLKQQMKKDPAGGDANKKGPDSGGGGGDSGSATASGRAHHHSYNRAKWESHWRAMKDQMRRLTAENHGKRGGNKIKLLILS